MKPKERISTQTETALRRKLGIPDDVGQVLIFAESSHWDPDWVLTAQEYYRRFVERNLNLAIEYLVQEPRRVYSIECIFFFRMYWDRNPGKQEMVRRLVNEGRLRFTSSGVTTADTLLPSVEAILRDFLIGQEWLRENGLNQEPRLAYFTDSFGCSPTLPSLLRAAGFDRTAITRIDGMYFPGADLESARGFPRPGSTAARLLQVEKSLDFIWRDVNGAQVLCHWNAYTYGQGDLLTYRGFSRTYIFPSVITVRSERHIARRIAQYSRQLEPYSKTPYLFCPIGFDFVEPIPDLVELLERYNRVRYPDTGVWALLAGLDDYLDLVECHREVLPVMEIDPNPYWSGFYTSRPVLKDKCRTLVEKLQCAELLAVKAGQGAGSPVLQELAPAWWDAVVTNHHDFITGTSPDSVVYGEQFLWIKRSMERVDSAIQQLQSSEDGGCAGGYSVNAAAPVSDDRSAAVPVWSQEGGALRVETPDYSVDLSEQAGGCILRAWNEQQEPSSGEIPSFLRSLSNDLVSYRDSGGLWRMGHEYRGGSLVESKRASSQGASLQVLESGEHLELVCGVRLDGETIRRKLWFSNDAPLIFGRVEGRAPYRRTITLRFSTGISADSITMAQPGGVVVRPVHKLYQPTFWPLQDFVHLRHSAGGHGLVFFLRRPAAFAYTGDGCIELVALRNATHERAYRIIPFPALPASGQEREDYSFDYAVMVTGSGDWRQNGLHQLANALQMGVWSSVDEFGSKVAEDFTIQVECNGQVRKDVFCSTLKPASRGDGLVLRLVAYNIPSERLVVSVRGQKIVTAYLCDARERDLHELPVEDGRALLTMPGSIATLRLIVN